jgi:hypothetical protein
MNIKLLKILTVSYLFPFNLAIAQTDTTKVGADKMNIKFILVMDLKSKTHRAYPCQ